MKRWRLVKVVAQTSRVECGVWSVAVQSSPVLPVSTLSSLGFFLLLGATANWQPHLSTLPTLPFTGCSSAAALLCGGYQCRLLSTPSAKDGVAKWKIQFILLSLSLYLLSHHHHYCQHLHHRCTLSWGCFTNFKASKSKTMTVQVAVRQNRFPWDDASYCGALLEDIEFPRVDFAAVRMGKTLK